jgi:F0F1-type ATP synthase assembly protein I
MAKSNLLALGWAASQFGFYCVGGIVGGAYLDKYTSTTPLFTILGLVLGLFGGIRVLLLVAKSSNKTE